MPLSSHLPLGSVKATVAIVSPDAIPGRCSFLAASSPACRSVLVGEHGGAEVRGAQQGPAHLLEHHRELDEREALAAELLRHDHALQAQLVGHLAPHGGVVALVGVHEPAHLGLGRLALEELAGDAAELFLLLGEGEVHGRRVYAPARRPLATGSVYARVHLARGADRRPGAAGQPGRRRAPGRRRRARRHHHRRPPRGPARAARAGRGAIARGAGRRRPGRAAAPGPPAARALDTAVDVRLDRILDEVRGG